MKTYKIEGCEYRQEVLSIEQIKGFLRLLKDVGMGQLINAGQFDFDRVFEQIIEHDKIELFLATVLIPKEQNGFDKKSYAENLQHFSNCSGEVLAEVIEDFLSCNEPWFRRLAGMMGKVDVKRVSVGEPVENLMLTN